MHRRTLVIFVKVCLASFEIMKSAKCLHFKSFNWRMTKKQVLHKNVHTLYFLIKNVTHSIYINKYFHKSIHCITYYFIFLLTNK